MGTPWRLTGDYLELCNCDPGCGCNFRGVPNSTEGNCEAFVAVRVADGNFGDVDLAGAKIAWALWWPGAIHEGGGKGHAFMDVSTDAQFEALATIYRGEAGYSYFEIFNSTFTEPTAVERSDVELVLDGKNSHFAVSGVAEGVMEPLRNPVTGAENFVRIAKRDGFIWKDGEIVQGTKLKVDLAEMSFDVSGRHGVVSTFEWSGEKAG